MALTDIKFICPYCRAYHIVPRGTLPFHCKDCGNDVPTELVQAQQPPGVTLQ
jgi:hypothetical protein